MSRSTDMPFADDPLAEDPLLAELHAARPRPPADLLDPHTPANQAILQSIFAAAGPGAGADADRSNGVGPAGIHTPRDLAVRPAGARPGKAAARPRRRRTLHRLVVGAAAAAVITIGVVVTWPFSSAEPSAADVVRQAAAASGPALESGRAEVTAERTVIREPGFDEADPPIPPEIAELFDGEAGTDTYEYRFAGDDVAVQIGLGADREGGGSAGERRVVDGEMYWHVGPDPSRAWFRIVDDGVDRTDWSGDPRSLFAVLEPRGRFELVGDETIDGVETRHLRSTTPSDFTGEGFGLGQAADGVGVLDELEIWVDDDGVVRRIEIESRSTSDETLSTGGPPEEVVHEYELTVVDHITVRFTDFGVPNDIEVPSNICDLTQDEYTAGIAAPLDSPPPC